MADLTRAEVIKLIDLAQNVTLIGVDLSGLDLSRLNLIRSQSIRSHP